MKLNRIEWIDSQNNEKHVYTFDTTQSGKSPVVGQGSHTYQLLQFCFDQTEDKIWEVTTDFSIGEDQYKFRKVVYPETGARFSLRKKEWDKFKAIARGKNACNLVESLLKGQIAEVIKGDFIDKQVIDNFHGELSCFGQFKTLLEVADSVRQSSNVVQEQSKQVLENIKALAQEKTPKVSVDEIENLSQQINQSRQAIFAMQNRLTTLKQESAVAPIANEILTELSQAQVKYQKLDAQSELIQHARERLQSRDAIVALVPSMRTLEKLAEQRAQYDRERHQLVSEIDWIENEIAAVNDQIAEKQKQTVSLVDKRNKSEIVNAELANIADLYERNKLLNQALVQLTEQQERLLGEKALLKNKRANVMASIDEIKERLDQFKVPNKSVGELLETVRVDVKLDEVQSQIERVQSEIAVKESQIAEKESNLVLQVRKFKSVAELDVAISPIKAKDTILQVLDGKLTKLEMVNESLKEKQKNLQRAYEDYTYKLVAVEQSRGQLEAQLEKVQYKKQEEFKREVYINSQKVYSDDMTGVFAVTTRLDDEEIVNLKKQIGQRDADRNLLSSKASQLSGRMDEIKRQMEINEAELSTLRKEKLNIINRYNEIVTQNRNETVFNYLKAVESNNGTKYLLDVQQDAVRNEAELAELKRTVGSLKGRLQSLQGRQRYLKETQRTLDSTQASVDTIVETNDQVKDQLADISGRLSANYEQNHAISAQLDELEDKIVRVSEMLVETQKTIKVNERQIALSQQKAGQIAEGQDLETIAENAKVEAADLEGERLVLVDNKTKLEKELFKKRLELEKSQWIYDSKTAEYEELKEKVQFELNLKGLSIDQVEAVNFEENSQLLRDEIAQYDNQKSALAEKIENLYAVLKAQPDGIPSVRENLADQITSLQGKIDLLTSAVEQLEKARQEKLQHYLVATNQKMKLASAAAEAQAYSKFKKTLRQNDVMEALLEEKINDVLSGANKYCQALCGKEYVLKQANGIIALQRDDQLIQYDQLDDAQKVLLYVTLALASPSEDGRQLLFGDDLPIEGEQLQKAIEKIDNVNYLIDVSKEQIEQEVPQQ